MAVRRQDHVAMIVVGCTLLFVSALAALFSTDIATTRADFFDGNKDCSSPENGACTYGYVCEDGKKGVIGKPCDDVGKTSGKRVTGICILPGVCEAKEYDGHKTKTPDQFEDEAYKAKLNASVDESPAPPAPQQSQQKGMVESLLKEYYGYSPQSLLQPDASPDHDWNKYLQSSEGKNLIDDFENSGIPLEFDGQTGKFTQDTYERLNAALEKNIGELQVLPQGSQYSDDSGKPSLWQSGVQATGWAEKGVTVDSSPDSWWEKAWDGTKSFVGNLFGAPDELPEGAFPEKSPLWDSAIETARWKQDTDSKTGPLRAGQDGKINPVDFAKRAAEKIADSSLNGKAPSYLREFGIKTGSPDEWARLATMLCQQESGCRVARVNADGSLQKFPTTPQGEKSYGPLQFDKGQYGLKTWSDVNDPDRVIDAFIRVAERDKLLAYFGSMQRPQETLQHSSWYDSKIAPYVGNAAPSPLSLTNSANLNQVSFNWSAYQLDLSYSFPQPQLASGASEFDVPGPFTPALITEYQTGGYDIPTFYADYAAPEPVSPQMPLYSGPDIASEPPQEYYVAQNEPSGAEFPGQPEPDNDEHSQARQLVERAIDWTQDQYRSLNEGLQTLWDQEISRRIAGDFNMADNEWPLTASEELFAQQEAVRAAEEERQVERTKWQAAYEQLVGTYEDPIGDFSGNSVTAEDIARAYDDSIRAREDDIARVNDPDSLTPSQGVPPAVAGYEEGLTESQKSALDKAISDAQKAQKDAAPVEVAEPRGARAKTLAEWYRENDKQLASREQRAADYDASLAGCGSGAYRGTACQNAWLLKRYQDESWADARAAAKWEEDRYFTEQSGNTKDENLQTAQESTNAKDQELIEYLKNRKMRGGVSPDNSNVDVAVQSPPDLYTPTENPKALSDQTPSQSIRELASRAYDVARDSLQSAWDSAREWWGSTGVELSSDSAVPLANAPEPENPVGEYLPHVFTKDDVVRPEDSGARTLTPDEISPDSVTGTEYAASNKESLSKEDALAVKDAVEDAADDAFIEEEATTNAVPAVQPVSPNVQQAAQNLQSARQRLSNANSALAQAFRDARDGNVDVRRITTAMNNLTASRDALQAAYRQASLSGAFTSSELSSINNSIQNASGLVSEVSGYRPYLSILNQGAVQQYWPRISALMQQGNSVVASLNRSINAPTVMGYTRRNR